jgi:hypothetical protein
MRPKLTALVSFLALRNEPGMTGSDPCRCVIFVDAAVVEQES